METTGIVIVIRAEFTTCVKLSEYNLNTRNTRFRVNVSGDTTAVIFNGYRAIFIKLNFYFISKAVSRFVYGVINYFPKDMMKTFNTR